MRNAAAASVISKHKRTSFFFLILIKSILYYQPFSFLGQFHQTFIVKRKFTGAQFSAKIQHSISPTFCLKQRQ